MDIEPGYGRFQSGQGLLESVHAGRQLLQTGLHLLMVQAAEQLVIRFDSAAEEVTGEEQKQRRALFTRPGRIVPAIADEPGQLRVAFTGQVPNDFLEPIVDISLSAQVL